MNAEFIVRNSFERKKMKQLITWSAAFLLAVIPQLNAQEAEAPNPDAVSSFSADPKEAAAKDDRKADLGKDADKSSRFAKQQEKIKNLQGKLNKAKRSSERRKIQDDLERAQRELKTQLNQALKPLKERLDPMKERVRLSSGARREAQEKEMAALEEKIKSIEAEAALETWCKKVDSAQVGETPNPGPGKKLSKSKKSGKKQKTSKNSKTGKSKKSRKNKS